MPCRPYPPRPGRPGLPARQGPVGRPGRLGTLLPTLKYEEIKQHMGQLAGLSQGSQGFFQRISNNKWMKSLLLWLWDTAVGPVFDELHRCGVINSADIRSTNLKRVWWIGVGLLSMAPFHAAGDHSPGSYGTLSRVASSYIATIKALSYARQKEFRLLKGHDNHCSTEPNNGLSTLTKGNTQLLLVPMPTTPGEASLGGVDEEIQEIHNSATKNAIKATVLPNPTPAQVLAQIQYYHIIHLACHGMSEINPSDSHLVLLTPDGENADKLMVRDISNASTPNSQLAYLSVCSSAKNSSTDLADEVIHLASAFQIAGFSHVLANMWKANDAACRDVAKEFYKLLFNYDGDGNGHRKVAISFHEAVKKVRDKRPLALLTWATFIHTGA
ncbi:hypothetical protein L873DRAFT_1778830 [Choiromyces venosus 120613-1]|uniref:CHAT domain-containing protein n=1 Tax=Choiromyces venosus 120613-1 TaxID=1336337 RepID=A0A3N4J6Y2_9PEZI|nr:hypothetical protein L873DRAFT_1778830 [Choiromyces venosus 120613-1]